jgi:two-component system NarL family sensor kinase
VALRSEPRPASGRAVALQVGQFALAGVVALSIVGLATAVASRRVGQREAVADARTTTLIKAKGVVEPAVTDGLLTGDPAAIERVSRVVQHDVLDRSLVRVKIWTASGVVIYSDEQALIGSQYELGADDVASLGTGRIDAEVSDLSKPENRYERSFGKMLEVYLPIHAPSGQPLLFEAYYRYGSVSSKGTQLWRSFAPISLGALVALELVQIPLAWSLARRLRQRLREREALMQRTLEASEVERRQIASDLHDGVVQDLAGVAYALSAVARQPGASERGLVEEAAGTVRGSMRALRSLIVDIYPPNLGEEGLVSALSDLLTRTEARGVSAALDVSGLDRTLPDAAAGLVYRAAQEALRNVVNHAGASTVSVRLSASDGAAVLEVTDDGRGFDDSADAPAGHVGLRALSGLVADAGGSLAVRSTPGTGTTVRMELPL